MSGVPVATYAGNNKLLALAALPLAAISLWGLHHLFSLVAALTGAGSPLALTWFAAFLLLWWVPLSWAERPFTARPRAQRALDQLHVAALIPVYNEPPDRLRACLESLLAQERPVERIHVVDDGTTRYDYTAVRDWFIDAAPAACSDATWTRTENQGKRHAQMTALAVDQNDVAASPADVYLTLDSDTILDARANAEGLKAFADPGVHSVAGMVAVWNSHGNWLARLTCMLYTPFTRGFRPAQSVLRSVMVNSGTLAWYRGDTIRKYADSYPRETFLGRPMQMNDDSMMTLYGLLEGKAVHQPTAVAYTTAPEEFGEYLGQQLRWMRGTFVRTLWWWRYMPVRSAAFWMPLGETASLLLSLLLLPVILFNAGGLIDDRGQFLLTGAAVAVAINYVIALRYFVIRRTDESLAHAVGIFALAPVAGLWRLLVLRPLVVYAYCTFWRVSRWGTRAPVAAVPAVVY